MGNIKFYLASVLLLSSISSNAQTAPQIVYELQDTSLPSRIMCVFTTSEMNTPFERVKPQVILPMTRDSGDLRISSDSVMWLRFIFANPYRLMNWCPMTNKDSTFWKQFVFEQQKPVTRWYLITENNNIRRTKLYNRFGQVLDSGGYANNRFAQRVFKPSEDYFFPLESKRIINQHTGLVVPLAMDAMDTFYLLIDNRGFRTTTFLRISTREHWENNNWMADATGWTRGLLSIYLFFTMLLWLMRRERIFGFYCLYVSGILFYFIAASGVGYWLYWDNPLWEERAFLIGSTWAMTTFFLLMREFLKLSLIKPNLDKIILAIIGYSIGVLLASLPFSPLKLWQWDYDAMNFIFFVGLGCILYGGMLKIKQLEKPYFSKRNLFPMLQTLIPIPVFLSMVFLIYAEFDWGGYRNLDFYNVYPYIAITAEMLLMGLVLGWQVYDSIIQAERTKHEAIQELSEHKLEFEVTLHHFLKQNAVLIKLYTDKKYASDIELQDNLQLMIDTCNLSKIIINISDLMELLKYIKGNFNNIAKGTNDEDLLTFLDEDNPDFQNINLSIPVRNKLYWILWSALWNLNVHSKCKYATLKIQFSPKYPDKLELILKDDGIGLPHALGLDMEQIELNHQNYEVLCDQYFKRGKFGVRSYFSTAEKIKATAQLISNSSGTALHLIFFPDVGGIA